MCASYILKTTSGEISTQIEVRVQVPEQLFDVRVLPQQLAPVIVPYENKLIVSPMQFALVPSWSKERKVKFATHNARFDSIDVKPTWKGPLQHKRCLVPISEFIEPIYEGEFAGNMVRFSEAESHVLFAAGLWDEWEDHNTGEILQSFTIITDEPYPYIEKMGHDRSPLFLNKSGFLPWLDHKEYNLKNLKNLLQQHKQTPNFKTEKDRALKSFQKN